MKTWDYALAEEKPGLIVAHTANCPVVRAMADGGLIPVATLMGCEFKLPDEYPRHECLNGKE